MSARERVKSPDELRPGDRVEVAGTTTPIVVDCLAFTDGRWTGLVVWALDPTVGSDGRPVRAQRMVAIDSEAYLRGHVSVRRRSREGEQVGRALKVQR